MEEEEEKDEEGGGRPDTGPSMTAMTAINAMLPKCISFLHRFQACWVQDTPQTDYYMHVKRLSKTNLRPAGCKINSIDCYMVKTRRRMKMRKRMGAAGDLESWNSQPSRSIPLGHRVGRGVLTNRGCAEERKFSSVGVTCSQLFLI